MKIARLPRTALPLAVAALLAGPLSAGCTEDDSARTGPAEIHRGATEPEAPSATNAGQFWFDTTSAQLRYSNGARWVAVPAILAANRGGAFTPTVDAPAFETTGFTSDPFTMPADGTILVEFGASGSPGSLGSGSGGTITLAAVVDDQTPAGIYPPTWSFFAADFGGGGATSPGSSIALLPCTAGVHTVTLKANKSGIGGSLTGLWVKVSRY